MNIKNLLALCIVLFMAVPSYALYDQYQNSPKHEGVIAGNIDISIPLCLKWQAKIGTGRGQITMLTDDGTAIYNTYNAVWGFDAVTGAVKWQSYTGTASESPGVIYGNSFIVPIQGPGMRAYDTRTGAVLWTKIYTSPGLTYNSFLNPGYTYGAGMMPTLYNGYVFIGTQVGYLLKINASNGDLVWSKKITPSTSTMFGAPAVDTDGSIYAGTGSNLVMKLNQDGQIIWNKNVGTPVFGSISIDNDGIYFGTNSSVVYSLSKSNGATRWTYATYGFIAGGGALKDGTYYIPSDDRYVHAINCSNGTRKWITTFLEDNFAKMSCIIVGEILVVGGCIDKILYININDGSLKKTCHSTMANFSNPSYGFGNIFIGSDDGTLYAIGPCPPECSACGCDARTTPTVTWMKTITPSPTQTKTPTYTHTGSPTPTYTFTFTRTQTPTYTFTFTATETQTYTFTSTATNTSTDTATSTFTTTPTRTFTMTPTATFTKTPTNTMTSTSTYTPTATNTPNPCLTEKAPAFTVKMIFNPESTDNIIFEIESDVELVSPPSATIYPHGATCNKSILTLTSVLIPGETKKYRVLYPKQTGFGDIDKVIVKGTSKCGRTTVSDGSFEKSVISGQDVKVIDNVIDPDKGERVTLLYKIYAGDNVTIDVYDRSGRKIKSLFSGTVAQAGTGEVKWDGRNSSGTTVASGIYIIKIKTSYYEEDIKVSVTR